MEWRARKWWQRLRPDRVEDAAVDEEMRFHVDMAMQRNVARGMTPEAARRDALLRFGGVDRFREAAWDVQRNRRIDDFRQDAVHALRLLRRSPAFAIAALLTLALGIGANTAIFSVLDAVLLRPMPYANPDELVSIQPDTYSRFREWTENAQSLEASGAYTYSIATVTGGAEPARVWTLAVTSSLLPTLGVSPLYGRGFTAEDDRPPSPPRVLLRHGFWQTQFGGDVGIVGRTIDVNGRPHEVIGILPPELEFPPPARRADGSMPMMADVWTGIGWLSDLYERGGFSGIARLADGWTAAAAADELSAAANAARGAAAGDPMTVQVQHVDETVLAPLRPAVLAFTAGIALVLLVACANLSSMLLARFSGRAREMAVRASLGAPRGRIVRQVLTEGAVLAACGSIAALGVAWLMLRVLLMLAPAELARVHDAGLNPRVLVATLGLGMLTTLLIGVLPAWSALRGQPGSALGSTRGATSDRGTGRVQAVLVTCEVAFAVVLLVAGGLLLRSFSTLAAVSPGFDTAGLVTVDVLLSPDRYDSRSAVLQFFERLEERVAARRGVTSVSAIDRLPYGPSWSQFPIRIAGRAPAPGGTPEPRGYNTAARPGYFHTMGIPLLRGRDFTHADNTSSSRVVIVSRTLADQHWPGGDPLGARLAIFGEEWEIVGVVGDVRHLGPATPVDPLVYLPHAQDPANRRMMTIVARTDGAPDALADAVRAEIRTLDAQLPISNLRSFGTLRSERTASQRFSAVLVASFAALALALAAVGIYGVMSFVVAQRTREIGVRMALGASRASVLVVFLRRAMTAVGFGVVAGVALAVPLTTLLRSMLFGVPVTDVRTYSGVVILVGVISLIVAWVPARRASRVEPNVALVGD